MTENKKKFQLDIEHSDTMKSVLFISMWTEKCLNPCYWTLAVCVCVCVCERERERERENNISFLPFELGLGQDQAMAEVSFLMPQPQKPWAHQQSLFLKDVSVVVALDQGH